MQQSLVIPLRKWLKTRSSTCGLFTCDGQPHALLWRDGIRCGVGFVLCQSVPGDTVERFLTLLAQEGSVPRNENATGFSGIRLDSYWRQVFQRSQKRLFFEEILDEYWLWFVLTTYLREVTHWNRADGIELVEAPRQYWGTIIHEIRERMCRFPGARVEHDSDSIAYIPEGSDGFVVRLVVLKRSNGSELYSVYYDQAHEDFADRSSAVLAFGFGLSTGCRVRVFSRGGEAYHWVVDVSNAGQWRPHLETVRRCKAFWQFWRSPKVRCLQNQLIDLDSDPPSPSA